MVKNHIKSASAPKSWAHGRKKTVFVTRMLPGAHKKELAMPLSIILKESLKFGKTTKEAKTILNTKILLVDQKRRKDYKDGVGFTDTISIPEIKKNYRMTISKKGKLVPKEISAEEAKIKPCKIINKKNLGKNRYQLLLSGGRNIIVDEKDNSKVGDTIILELPAQKIKKTIKIENDSIVFLTGGKHIGKEGTITSIEGNKITLKHADEEIATKKEYAFAIGKTKSEVTL